mgnify:CR=1 FL=1
MDRLWAMEVFVRVVECGEARTADAQQARALFETPQPVSLSIGATLFDQPGTELSHWLKQADQALYASKRKGRDRMELVPLAPGRPH